MCRTAGPLRCKGSCLGLLLALAGLPAMAQSTGDFLTGPAARAWDKWEAAMQAVLARNADQAEQAFAELLTDEPSPFRLALLADRSIEAIATGGAVMLLEQDAEVGALGPNARTVVEQMFAGREQMNEADDGWYFCQIGRFDVAEANFRALLASNPDPVALMEFTDRVPKRRDILVQLLNHPMVGGSVREVLKLLERGERSVKADPTRVKENIERLGGSPRAFENAVEALKDSGEYAIPFLIQCLRDSSRPHLLQPALRCLPTIDRPALNPLVMALRMHDEATKRYVIDALGRIGYAQAVPYLLALEQNEKTPVELRQSVSAALSALQTRGAPWAPGTPAGEAFFQLAEDYFTDKPSLAADVRLDTANVWYWRDDVLQNIEVPTPIFNEVMCLRCCEEALRLDPKYKPAIALWLAANFRREAQLPDGTTDATRTAACPTAAYFAQSAGAEYCLKALARAIDTADPAIALGAIEALQKTAGPASLLTDADGRLPLAEALSFPDRMVRVRAALTLGSARPLQTFQNHQNLMPVLSEALILRGGERNALVVDPDAAAANIAAGALRGLGYEVLIDAALFPGLEKVRTQLPGIDVVVLASNSKEPTLAEALAALRREPRFAATPIVIAVKRGDGQLVRELVRADYRLAEIPDDAAPADIERAVGRVSKAAGTKPITPDIGARLALEATEVLRALALTNSPVFDIGAAEPALLASIETDDVALRLAVSEVLGYLGSSKAQEAIAKLALDAKQPEDMRVKMFTALAEAAKRRGNLLGPNALQQVIGLAESDSNMTIREAASRTLGALNVPGEPASTIIRNQYQG